MVRHIRGRRKVEMVKMTNKASLQVTFSKRRSGLFKKASELCTLCDAHVAVIVFSPSGKVFSFGHPCVNLDPSSGRDLLSRPNTDLHYRRPFIQMLNDRLTEAMAQKEKVQRNRAAIVLNERKNKNPENWWTKPEEELNLSQLTSMKHGLEKLMREVDEVLTSESHQTNPNHYVGSSSNAAPAIVNGGYIFPHNQLDQNGMTNPTHALPFGFNVMNRTPAGYQNQEFRPAYPHHIPMNRY